MIHTNAKDERFAAKQDLTELLTDILIPPFKREMASLFEENIYPLEKGILEKQGRLEAQVGKVTRFIAKHYPEYCPPLEEQLQALQFAQQDSDELARAHHEELRTTLSQQAKGLDDRLIELLGCLQATEAGQENLHSELQRLADKSHEDAGQLGRQLSSEAEVQRHAQSQALAALEGLNIAAGSRLNEHQQWLQVQLQAMSNNSEKYLQGRLDALSEYMHRQNSEGVRRLEKLLVMTARQQREMAQTLVQEQAQRLYGAWIEQASGLRAQHETCVQSLAQIQQQLQAQQAGSQVIMMTLDRNYQRLQRLLYWCTGAVLAGLGVVAYLLIPSG